MIFPIYIIPEAGMKTISATVLSLVLSIRSTNVFGFAPGGSFQIVLSKRLIIEVLTLNLLLYSDQNTLGG